jgi:hypothetical protein
MFIVHVRIFSGGGEEGVYGKPICHDRKKVHYIRRSSGAQNSKWRKSRGGQWLFAAPQKAF